MIKGSGCRSEFGGQAALFINRFSLFLAFVNDVFGVYSGNAAQAAGPLSL